MLALAAGGGRLGEPGCEGVRPGVGPQCCCTRPCWRFGGGNRNSVRSYEWSEASASSARGHAGALRVGKAGSQLVAECLDTLAILWVIPEGKLEFIASVVEHLP